MTEVNMNYKLLDEAKELIGDNTPLSTDCGALCNAACCNGGSEDAGVWLLPGETPEECTWGKVSESRLPVAGTAIPLLMCENGCIRKARPFMCRIFPLTPFYSKKREVWDVRMDRRAAPMCPLFRCGAKGLSPAFTESARAAIRLLASDPEWEEVLKTLAAEEAVYHMEL